MVLVMSSIIILVVILMIAAGVAFIVTRRIKFEAELANIWWKISWDDLVFAEKQAGKRSTLSLGVSENSFTRTATSVHSSMSLASSMNTTSKNVHGVLIAMYKVWMIKRLN